MIVLKLGKWESLAAACWAILAVVVGTLAIVAPHRHSVYPIFANAARRWVATQELYGRIPGETEVYHYSPLVAVLLVPFSLMPDGPAGAGWRLLNVAVLLWGALWWARAVLPREWTGTQRAQLLLLVLPLSVACLHNGQSNGLVLGLTLAAVAAAAEQRWAAGSTCVALACMLKVYPLAVGLLLATMYPRQLTWRIALAVAACLGLPFLANDPEYVVAQYRHWVAWLSTHDRHQLVLENAPRDAWLLIDLYLFPLSNGAYHAVQAFAAAGCAALCLCVRHQPPGQRLRLLTGLACCWMVLFGPATESNTYVLLAVPLSAALLASRGTSSPRVRVALWGSYLLLLGSFMSHWFPWGRWVTVFGPQPLAALIFLGSLLWEAFAGSRRGRGEAPQAVVHARLVARGKDQGEGAGLGALGERCPAAVHTGGD